MKCLLKLKGVVYKSYVRSAIMYESNAWCLKDRNVMKDREIHCESNVWSTTER